MIAILWKEYREQRFVWLTFACLGILLVFGVAPLLDEAMAKEVLVGISILLGWVFGVVSGSMLLAGEREMGTQAFLDALPAGRWAVWRAKLLAGLTLSLTLAVVLVGMVLAAGRTDGPGRIALLIGAPSGTLCGLIWGLCGGTYARTVLGGVGRVLFVQLLLFPVGHMFLVFIPMTMLASALGVHDPAVAVQNYAALPSGALYLLLPLPLSALTYTASDRARRPGHTPGPEASPYGVMFLLAWRRLWGPLLLLTLVAVPGGVLILKGGQASLYGDGGFRLAAGPGLWIGLTAAAGVVIGAILFSDEQAGPRRFLVEQRFALGPLWWTRVLTGFVGLTAVWLLLLLPTLVAVLSQRPDNGGREVMTGFGTSFLGRTIPIPSYLLMWPATGFACGAVAGLLFRKPVIAVFVGMLSTAALVAPWLPSLLTGGMWLWQPLAPAVALLALSRGLMHPWATDTLGHRPGVRRVFAGGLAVVALITAGLGWRVLAVPHVPEPAGLAEYEAKVPDDTENEGGELTRRACEHVAYQSRSYYAQPVDGEMAYFWLLGEVIGSGWPNNPGLGGWLDEQMKGGWVEQLGQAAEKPTGVVLDPRRTTYGQAATAAEGAYPASLLLAADGLRKKDGVFVEHLARALAMARHLGEHGPSVAVGAAGQAELVQWSALDVWLGRLGDDRDLLRRAAHQLWRHRVPRDDQAGRLGDYLVARNSLDRPQEFYVPFLDQNPRPTADELSLLIGAFQVPWERARQLRLLRVAYFRPDLMPGHPGFTPRAVIPLPGVSRGSPERRRLAFEVARLKVALRLHQAEHGKPAARLADLLIPPPDDPFGGGPLKYRVEDGQGEIRIVGEDGGELVFRVPRPRR